MTSILIKKQAGGLRVFGSILTTQAATQRGNGNATEEYTGRGSQGRTPSTHLSTPANQDPLMCSDFTALTANFDQGQRMCWE
jgi:hypothetical protein